MNRRWRRGALMAAAVVPLVAASSLAQTTETKGKPVAVKAADGLQMATGVIVKVAPIDNGSSAGGVADSTVTDATRQPRLVRVTINTAAVWRDWVRDQASTEEPKSPKTAAAEGNASVATAGQPQSPDTLVVVDVVADTRVMARYRSATDEVSQGAKTPAGAARAEAATDSAGAPKEGVAAKATEDRAERSAAKPPAFTAADLKPGLFVEVDYRRVKNEDRATVVRVVRPVGGAGISAGAEPVK